MNYEYDYIVIGGGVSGCSIARRLSQQGAKVSLLESLDVMGGNTRPISFGGRVIDNGLRLFPDLGTSHSGLEFVSSVLGESLSIQSEENRPLTFIHGDYKPFLGFGEDAPAFYEQINYFLHEKRLNASIPSNQWSALILKDSGIQTFNRSIVTQLVIENGRINHLVVNGSKPMSAKSYIYTGSLRELIAILPKDLFSAKQLNRIIKDTYWSALTMDLHHKDSVTDLKNMFILNGTTQDDIGPCVGRFLTSAEGEQGQISQWLTFVSSEFTEDSEHVVHSLKKMKRQIQRAFPDSLKDLKGERIVLSSSVGGGNEYKINDVGQISQVENLWISSSGAGGCINLSGALFQARNICENLLGETSARFLVAPEVSL